MPEIGTPTKRYLAHAGFVTTPRYFDDSPAAVPERCPQGHRRDPAGLHIPNYEYELGQRARNFDLLDEAAICLGLSHAEVVGQVGTNWVHCNGTTPDDIRRLCDKISRKAGTRFLMAGMCIVEGLQAIGAKRIAVANSYYRRDWMDGINRFLEQAGFRNSLVRQCHRPGALRQPRPAARRRGKDPVGLPGQGRDPGLLSGPQGRPRCPGRGPDRLRFPHPAPYSGDRGHDGHTLISSDVALYWAMLRDLNIDVEIHDHGQLMATLG